MKKYSIVISLFAMLLTACDPTVEEEGSIAASMTEAQLEQAATLMQTVEGQNKFTYATNPSTTVQILDPSGNILTTGTSGSFDLTPGGEESQTFTIRTINQDGSITSFQKTFSITTYVDVDPAWAYLCGDGEKVWTYDSEVLGGCWGNLGYKAASNAEDFITNKNGIWWTCAPADLTGQLEGLKVPATGEETPDAYMTFILSGEKIVKNTGSQTINEGTFSFDMTASDSWEIGKLYTSEGAILFPYMINGNGYKPTEFDIMLLNDKNLVLTYAASGTAQWGEATFWAFKAKE